MLISNTQGSYVMHSTGVLHRVSRGHDGWQGFAGTWASGAAGWTPVPLFGSTLISGAWYPSSAQGVPSTGTAEIRAKIGHRHWPKSRGFGHATFNAEKRRLSSPFDHNGQRGFWPGQKQKGIANHWTNKAIVLLCPKSTRISAIPDVRITQFQALAEPKPERDSRPL